MKYLIINADDFGLHEYINAGIIKGFQEGCITSASLMCSAPAFRNAVDLAKENPALGIGVHLTLVGGVKSMLPSDRISSLLDKNSLFIPDYVLFVKRFMVGMVKKDEIKAELSAQIECALHTGLPITHVDSHQHLHVLPGIIDIVIELCNSYGIAKVRVPAENVLWSGGYSADLGRFVGRFGLTVCAEMAKKKLIKAGLKFPEHFFGMLAGGNLDGKLVRRIIADLPEGVSEIMTHPGVQGSDLSKLYFWGYHWEEELAAFLAPETKAEINEQRISLINFGGLDYAK